MSVNVPLRAWKWTRLIYQGCSHVSSYYVWWLPEIKVISSRWKMKSVHKLYWHYWGLSFLVDIRYMKMFWGTLTTKSIAKNRTKPLGFWLLMYIDCTFLKRHLLSWRSKGCRAAVPQIPPKQGITPVPSTLPKYLE